MNLPFVCSFDEYIDVTTNACGGFSYVATNLASLAGLELDLLPGSRTIYITDYTSIGKCFLKNKTFISTHRKDEYNVKKTVLIISMKKIPK